MRPNIPGCERPVTLINGGRGADILVFWHLCSFYERYRPWLYGIQLSISTLKNIMIVGIPAGIQAMQVTLLNLIIQKRINRLRDNCKNAI